MPRKLLFLSTFALVVALMAVVVMPVSAGIATPTGTIDKIWRSGCTITVSVTLNDPAYYVLSFYDEGAAEEWDDFYYAFAYLEDSGTYEVTTTFPSPIGDKYIPGVAVYLQWWDGVDYQLLDADFNVYVPSDCGEGNNTFFDPGDDRINKQAYASFALYCDADNSEVDVYTIVEGEGVYGFSVPYSDLTASSEAGVIASFAGINFERNANGGYFVYGGVNADGKVYGFEFDGCEPTSGQAYIIEDGVTIPTETVNYVG